MSVLPITQPLRSRAARLVVAALVSACTVLALGESRAAASSQDVAAKNPSITAAPNPVPAGKGPGATRIAWTTGSDADGEVRVSIDGAPDRTFARGKSGSALAEWISDGRQYEFILYLSGAPTVALARVKVSRVSPLAAPQASRMPASIDANPRIVPGGGPGATTVSWNTGDGSDGEIRVSINKGPERTFAKGKTGRVVADWIQGGSTYDFRLYVGSATTASASVSVSRAAAPPGAARISASPNPVPSGPGAGETTVSWTTGNGADGRVKVAVDDGLERVIGQGPTGELRVNWINSSAAYEFRLYSAGVPSSLLAKVSVSRTASTAPIRTPPAITFSRVESSGGLSRIPTRVNWTTGDRSDGRIYVSKNGGSSEVFGQGPTGSVVADWVHPGSSYEFKLYSVATGALLASDVLVTAPGGAPETSGEGEMTPARMAAIRSRSFIAVVPNPVPAGLRAASIDVSWFLDYLDHGRVTLSVDGNEEREIDKGSGGNVTVPSIRAGSTYELRLYGGDPSTRIVSLTVTRRSAGPWVLAGSGLLLSAVSAGFVIRRRSRRNR